LGLEWPPLGVARRILDPVAASKSNLHRDNLPAGRDGLLAQTSRPLSARHLIARQGADAGARVIVPELTPDCPHRDSAALMERCDILFPELRELFRAR